MRHDMDRARTILAVVAGSVLAGGCATTLPDVGAADVARLTLESAERPEDVEVRVHLGIAQYRGGDHAAALASLTSAVDAGHTSGAALLHLGLVHEELEAWDEARSAYARFLDEHPSSSLRRDVEARIRLMARNALRRQAREALDLEGRVADAGSPTPRSVAVLPFAFNSTRSELEPLTYALADMMSTDFAMSNAVVVLERARVQSLLDEMSLTEAGYADGATGARAGRLLRAEHVVQGVLSTLGQDRLRTDAEVLSIPRQASAGELSEDADLDELFAMEKALVIRTIRDVLGLQLTPAEEQAILENRMENVLAFLAYGEGLRALDRGDYATATERFNAAIALEGPGNPMLESALEGSNQLATAEGTETPAFAARAREPGALGDGVLGPAARATLGTEGVPAGGRLRTLTDGIAPTPASGLLDLGSLDQGSTRTNDSGDTEREPIAEASGEAGLTGSSATIRLVIPAPGGGR